MVLLLVGVSRAFCRDGRQTVEANLELSQLIPIDVPRESTVNLAVYNMVGQRVRSLGAGCHTGRSHQIVWDGRSEYGRFLGTGSTSSRMQAGFSKYSEYCC